MLIGLIILVIAEAPLVVPCCKFSLALTVPPPEFLTNH